MVAFATFAAGTISPAAANSGPSPAPSATEESVTEPSPDQVSSSSGPPAASVTTLSDVSDPATPFQTTAEAPTSAHVFETTPYQGKKGTGRGSLATTESYSGSRAGDIKVRLVTVQLADVKADISMDSAVAAVAATSTYWQNSSNGRLSLSVASKETFNSRGASSTQSYSAMMNTITSELGWVPSPYTALVVFVSATTLSDGAYGAGWSYNGTSGRVLMPLPRPEALTQNVLAHEFGHVLGLMHSNSLECGSGAQDVATKADGSFADSTCRVREYGDTLDIMGAAHASRPAISSPLWAFGGFGRGDEIRNVGTAEGTQSHVLSAWAGSASGRAIRFTDAISGEVYYLELRLPVGYDSGYAVKGNRGVKIIQSFGAGSLTLMPDSRPFPGYYSANHAWQPGQTFTTHTGTRVSIDWVSDTAAGVTINALPPIKSHLLSPGDFNGDGRTDLIQRKATGELWFYPGDGIGKSLPGRKIGWGWEIYDTVFGTGDFNGDGNNDLVARKYDGSLWFYAGTSVVSDRSEGYLGGVKIGDFGWDSFDTLLGVQDLDADGYSDILARQLDGSLLLYPGNGSGRPGTPRQIGTGWQAFDQLIAIRDFNKDGSNDLAARKADGTLWFFANTGVASFREGQQIGTGWQIYDQIVGVGDANGDSTADFAGQQTDGSTYFYAGTAMQDEGYTAARKIGDFGWVAFNYLCATKDFNGDAYSDLVARKPDGTLWFYPGNGNGAYGVPTKIGNFGWEVFDSLTGVGDFNGDGKNDFLARKTDGTLWLYLGTGRVDSNSPGYSSSQKIGNFGWEVFTSLAGPGDLNGDGRSDILARKADGTLWLYAGSGTVDATSSGYASALKIGDYGWQAFDQLFGSGDFSGDGKNDVIARKPDGSVWLYPGAGDGTLASPRRIGTGWEIYNTVLGAGMLTADTFADLVARKPDGSLWAYSGTGMQPSAGYLGRAYSGTL